MPISAIAEIGVARLEGRGDLGFVDWESKQRPLALRGSHLRVRDLELVAAYPEARHKQKPSC